MRAVCQLDERRRLRAGLGDYSAHHVARLTCRRRSRLLNSASSSTTIAAATAAAAHCRRVLLSARRCSYLSCVRDESLYNFALGSIARREMIHSI